MKTKICHVTSVHKSTDPRIFYKECASLAKHGYEVHLVAPGESRTELGVTVHGIGPPETSRWKRMTQMTKRAYEAAKALQADVYHLHDPELLPIGLKLRKQGAAVIFDSHEDIIYDILDKGWIPAALRKPIAWGYEKYERHILKQFQAVITVSPNICLRFQNLPIAQALITNFPIWDEEMERTHCKVSADEFTVVFAGTLATFWNFEVVAKAMKPLHDVRFIVCGKGDVAYLQSVIASAEGACIDYLGQMSQQEVTILLNRATLGIALLSKLPSKGGEVGTLGVTKLFEYMQAGLPVVCSNNQIWKEIIDKWGCGIAVEPDDVDAVAEAFRKIFENPALAEEMGRRGQKAVREEYGWQQVEPVLFALYDTVLAK